MYALCFEISQLRSWHVLKIGSLCHFLTTGDAGMVYSFPLLINHHLDKFQSPTLKTKRIQVESTQNKIQGKQQYYLLTWTGLMGDQEDL